MLANVVMNNELKGVEIYFDDKPMQNIIDDLKGNGFRWHGVKKCWYAKQNEKTLNEAQKYTETNTEQESETKKTNIIEKEKQITIKNQEVKSLWDLTRWSEDIQVNNKQSTKEIAAEIRKHIRSHFPMCKFSVKSDYSSISFYIVSSPYEKESVYLKAIEAYCTSLIKAYHYCTCDDPYGDYGSSYNFYGAYAKIDYEYKQTEQTEQIKSDMLDFDAKQIEFEKVEEEQKEKEFQEYLIKQEEDKKRYEEIVKEETRQTEIINNSVNVIDIGEEKQYFVIGSQFANLNKNNTLDEYKEEIKKDDYYLQNVKITKEVHFQTEESLNYFSNLLLHDFDFLEQTGGSFTEDIRVNTMTDYHNMDKKEQETVIFNLYGVAIYYNNQLQFIVDAQGFSYARYVGLVEGVTIKKENPIKQFYNSEQIQELKEKAETLTDYSTSIITENNIVDAWDNEKWNEYKELIKDQLKKNNFRLSKAIIQQLPEDMEKLKIAMYKLLIEVDGIQEQFKNVNLQQGQKLTLFYISDWGSIVTSRITLDKVEYSKYAQYDNAVKLTFTPEKKRKLYYKYYYSTLLVYNGWLNLPETVLHDVETSNGMIITKTKCLSCDKKQYDLILEYFVNQGVKPIINTYKPMF